MKVAYQRERCHELFDEIMPLLMVHKEEVAHYSDILLDVDRAAYQRSEDEGLLRCYTARCEHDLIGYCIVFVRHNIHYRASLQALQDVLFVLPEYRKGRIGLGLIRYTEQELAKEGVQLLLHHVKAARTEGQLFERLGYELIDLVYGKRLDRKAE